MDASPSWLLNGIHSGISNGNANSSNLGFFTIKSAKAQALNLLPAGHSLVLMSRKESGKLVLKEFCSTFIPPGRFLTNFDLLYKIPCLGWCVFWFSFITWFPVRVLFCRSFLVLDWLAMTSREPVPLCGMVDSVWGTLDTKCSPEICFSQSNVEDWICTIWANLFSPTFCWVQYRCL